MLIDGVRYGQKKIYRIYLGGELFWYEGHTLPLNADIYLAAWSTADAQMHAIPLEPVNTENSHNLPVYVLGGGVAIGIAPFNYVYTDPIGVHLDTNLHAIPARPANHQATILVQEGCDFSGHAFDVITADHHSEYLAEVSSFGSATVIAARTADHILAHLVGIRSTASIASGGLVSLDRTVNLLVMAATMGTATLSGVVQSAHQKSVQMEAACQHNGTITIVTMGHRDITIDVKSPYQAAAFVSDAVLLNKDGGVLVGGAYWNAGTITEAISAHKDSGVLVSAWYRNYGTIIPLASLVNTIVLQVDTDTEASAVAARNALGNSAVTHLVIRKNELNASTHYAASFLRDATMRIDETVDGTINSDHVIPLSCEMAEIVSFTKEHHGNMISGIGGSGSSLTVLNTSAEGTLSEDVRIVSLAADISLALNDTTEAHLIDWRMPSLIGNDLYIQQVYEAWQNGSDLVLADNYDESAVWFEPVQSEDGLYIRQVFEATQNDSILILHGTEWLAPIETENGLYIRQAASATSVGSDLNMTN